MDIATEAAVKEILDSVLVDTSDDTKIRCYAAMKVLKRIVQRDSWRYPSAAWKHNVNDICKRIGGEVFTNNFLEANAFRERFNVVFETLSDLETMAFFLHFLPDYIAQPKNAFKILGCIQFKYSEYLPLSIQFVKQAFKTSKKNIQDRPGYISAIFTNDSELHALSDAVNKYPFTYERKRYTTAMSVLNCFERNNAAQIPYMVSIYLLVRSKLYGNQYMGEKRGFRTDVNDAAAYLRGIKKHKVDLLGTDEVVNEVVESIGRIKYPTDFLEVALVAPSNDDSRIEQDCIFTKLIEQQRFSANERILVINPAPSFIVKYANSQPTSNLTFAMEHELVAQLLKKQFGRAAFCTIKGFEDSQGLFDRIVFFSRNMGKESVGEIFPQIRLCCKESTRIYAVIPAEMLTWENSRESPLSCFGIERVDLFPKGAFQSTPKKKVMVYATANPVDDIVLVKHRFPQDSKSQKKSKGAYTPQWLEIVGKVWVKRDHLQCPYSIYDVWDKATKRKTEDFHKRKNPESYDYTPNIRLWYTENANNAGKRPMIEAYVCELPTPKQVKRNKLERGKKIKESVVHISTLESHEDIHSWLENELPYDKRIQKGVRMAFDGVSADDLCLKTLWYIQLELEKYMKSATYEDEITLIASEVGTIPYGDKKALRDAIYAFCDGMSVTTQLRFWRIIRNICNGAKAEGIVFADNIADKPIRDLLKRDDGNISEVKQALAKSSFSLDEEIKLVEYINEKMRTEPEYLAVLIRFYTGLQPNIISALTWGDVVKVPYMECYQIYISKQYRNDEQKAVQFENAEDYRRMPICSALSTALIARKKHVEQMLDPSRKIEDIQIIATDAQVYGEDAVQVTPRRINALSKKMLTALDIPEEIVELPKGNGGIEANMAMPHSRDIFRSNFKYRANLYCGFTDAEQRYVLGLSQISPYAKNYVDFSNDFCQYSIFKKLGRWDALHQGVSGAVRAESGNLLSGNSFEMRNCLTTLMLEIPVKDKVTVKLDSKYGLDVHVSFASEGGNNERQSFIR